jgi:acylphosphatase
MSEGSARRHVTVHGDVQGVSFREETRREAEDAGLAGWVRNRDDGSVEAVFEGDPDAVERLVEWCGSGPSGAEVESVEASEEEPRGDTGFEVR